ncbi:MAG: hypothetical protein JOS17DRAFT_368535 [Linnemannia elongata]|nr:MAG: hypothetical protein JOS17DRAFT_368535 [Linnemannia elongata]
MTTPNNPNTIDTQINNNIHAANKQTGMPSVVAVAVLPSSTEPCLELSSSPSSSSFLVASSSDAITATNLLTTATILAAAGQSLKCTEALIAQKQHQLTYIQQQQRIQQEKQRQLIYSQQQRHQQYLRCSGQLPYASPGRVIVDNGKNNTMGVTGKSKEPKAVDLVDDVWRLVFFILACDCKDIGRAMQVSRRFHKYKVIPSAVFHTQHHSSHYLNPDTIVFLRAI